MNVFIGLFAASMQPAISPAPPPASDPPVVVKRLPDYSGRCAIKPKAGDAYSVSFSARGKGAKRTLELVSDNAEFPTGTVKLSRTLLMGGSRYNEGFTISNGARHWEGSIEWYSNHDGAYLSVHEPIVVNVPIKYVVINRCDFSLKAK